MDNIFANLWRKRETTPASGVPASTTDKGPEVKSGSYEQRIIRANNPQTALTVSAVYRATELRAKTIGQMPVQYQRKDERGGNFVPWMMGLGKRMNYLLQEESDYYTPNCIGLKTGSTDNAGKCVITLFRQKDGSYLLIGVLGCSEDPSRFADTLILYNKFG